MVKAVSFIKTDNENQWDGLSKLQGFDLVPKTHQESIPGEGIQQTGSHT